MAFYLENQRRWIEGSLGPLRGTHIANKKNQTSSVYDCTVEDVEYICNSNSTLCFCFAINMKRTSISSNNHKFHSNA